LLTKALNSENFSGIHVINRAQLLDDALALARAGQLDYATAMDVTSYLEKELEYIPWKAALNALSYIDTMLVRTSAYASFKVPRNLKTAYYFSLKKWDPVVINLNS